MSLHNMEWRLQFLTALDIVCARRRCKWTVKGEFIRHLLSNKDYAHSSMTICLTRYPNAQWQSDLERFHNVIEDLAALKYIDQGSKRPVNAETTIYNSNNQFAVAFICGNNTANCFDIDAIVMTKHGLTVESTCRVRGISLVECLFKVSSRRIKRLMNYGPCHVTNGDILINEGIMLREGFKIAESPLYYNKEHLQNDCPICYEQLTNVPFTTIGCGHSMCINCLGSHMAKPGANHSQCPMCRTKIFLRV